MKLCMPMKMVIHLVLVTLGIGIVMSQNGMAQTRLGLHVTDVELSIWKKRAASGPYRTAGDVQTNSPGDWTRIKSKADSFLSNPSADRRVGQTADTCVKPNAKLDIAGKRGIGDKLRDAAFVYLVTGQTNYRTAVLKELLAQAAVPGTNMGNSARWCTSIALGDVDPTFDMATWQMKLLLGYDYLLAGDKVYGYALSSSEKAILDKWFLNAGLFWEQNISKLIRTRFPNRDSDNYSNPTNCCLDSSRVTHYGGYVVKEWHRVWSNRGLNQVRFWGAVGIMQSHSGLKASAKRYVKEIIKYHTWPDNTLSEFDRWFVASDTFPTLGFGYAGYMVHGMVGLADHFARAGDTELYTYSTTDGHQGTSGGPKSLRGIIELYMKHVNGVATRYGTDQAANKGNMNYRIDTVYEPKNWFSTGDVWLAQAVIYYRDPTMKSYILRNCSGCPGYPKNPAHGGFEPWGGEWGVYPGFMFMFGQMDGKVWPYNATKPYLVAPTNLRLTSSGQ